jgi:hypothetical protein
VKRAWDEWVASLFDVISPQLVLLILLGGAGLVGALWYWFPAWVPRRLPHWRLRRPDWRRPRWRLKRRERKPKPPKPPKAGAAGEEPAPVPVAALSAADRLAAQGRYAEAIRERLRETVGALSAAGVVAPEPGETAAEVAAAAAHRRPAVWAPLGNATELFSEVWYGDRPAGHAQDEHMRTLSGEVRARLRDADPR